MNHIYISKSKKISESGAFFREALDFLRKNNISCSWFPSMDRYYNDERLKKAKGVIILLETATTIIGKGVYTEIKQAEKLKKPVYILYKRQYDGSFHFYSYGISDCVDLHDWVKHTSLEFIANMTTDVIEKFQRLCKVDENNSIYVRKEEIIVPEFNNLELLLLRR